MQIKPLILLITLVWPLYGYAEQIKPASENKTISAKISAKELTRVYVQDDRILQVRGTEGTYYLEKDEREGAIFIRPHANFAGKPFSVFITTEQGRTYPLLLIPLDVPAETIAIKPNTPSSTAATRWESNTPYTRTLVNIITSMVTGKSPDGYTIASASKAKPVQKGSLKIEINARYVGARLQGEILSITNTSDTAVTLHAKQFYSNNALALALVQETLAPKQKTTLYRVVNRHD